MKIIFTLIALIFLISAPAAWGWIPFAPDIPAERTVSIHKFELNRKSIVVAENESEASESERPSTNENRDQTPETRTSDKEKSDKNSNGAATKPLKPFKPSEEIAAEQAVDFPVDI